jgi:hypothetical protein
LLLQNSEFDRFGEFYLQLLFNGSLGLVDTILPCKNTVFIGKVENEGLPFMQNIIIHHGNQNCACMVHGLKNHIHLVTLTCYPAETDVSIWIIDFFHPMPIM